LIHLDPFGKFRIFGGGRGGGGDGRGWLCDGAVNITEKILAV